jgi:hypothetical protein
MSSSGPIRDVFCDQNTIKVGGVRRNSREMAAPTFLAGDLDEVAAGVVEDGRRDGPMSAGSWTNVTPAARSHSNSAFASSTANEV